MTLLAFYWPLQINLAAAELLVPCVIAMKAFKFG